MAIVAQVRVPGKRCCTQGGSGAADLWLQELPQEAIRVNP